MEDSGKKTGQVLLSAGLITEQLLEQADQQQKKTGGRLTEILVGLGVDAEAIRQTLAARLKVPEVNLRGRQVDPDLMKLVPKSWVEKHGSIPLERVENILTLGMVNPFDIEVLKDIRFKTGLNVRVAVISETELPGMLESGYDASTKSLEINLDDLLPKGRIADGIEVLSQGQQEEEEEEFLEGLGSEAPIIRLVDRIIQDAVVARATDIHIEPARGSVRIRYRIDGVLADIQDIPKFVQGPLLSRIKVMGNMDISDKRRPQDGRSKIKLGERVVDLRISSLPTMFGEKIVLRLLEQKKGVISVGDVGFSPHVFQAINRLLDYPQGMILVTGPTGSGKTTTLYSALSRLNDGTTNIVTVEDPVEYQVPGINQVQINVKAGMTFASGARSILRQDPDVVLVGEMRDHETAEIAFHAAQTGHLVLSTLHTNDAASTVTRLLSMGIDPYLIASSVLGILAQRLVRHLCSQCKVPVSLDENLARWLPSDAEERPHQIFAAKSCKRCRETGFWDRFPIAEILVPNDTIRDLILKGRPDREIMNVARRAGMKTIFEDGVARVLQGLTTLEEVTRVVAPPRPPSEEGKRKTPLVALQGSA
ncbi:MAG: GspE/PulE family protein [Candidatus Binatia bacterium]